MLTEKPLDQQRDIFSALTQRRQLDGDDIQAVIEILAEAALSDAGLEITMRGSEDTDVDADGGGAADSLELSFLQYTK